MPAPAFRPVPRPALRPSPSGPHGGGPTAGVPQAGATAALWALLTGLVAVGLPVVLVWAADGRSSAGALDAVRTAGQVWLVAHGTPLGLPGGRLSLVPLGLLVLPLVLLVHAGRRAARQHPVADLRGAGRLVAAVAAPYAVVAGVVARLTETAAARPSLPGALLAAGLVAAAGVSVGVVRTCGLGPDVRAAVPAALRSLLRPAGAAVLVLLAAGAVLVGARLALEAPQAADLARASDPGVAGGVALLLLGLALVPNAVLWGACWWAGPGFAVGTGTSVGPLSTDLGPVPGLPLLAALPDGALPAGVGVLALLVPLAAGLLAGLLVLRSDSATPRRDAALSGLPAGLGLGLLAWASGGAAGGARLAELGPSAWQCAAALTVAVSLPAYALVRRRTREQADPGAGRPG